jgi:hypothetical protein
MRDATSAARVLPPGEQGGMAAAAPARRACSCRPKDWTVWTNWLVRRGWLCGTPDEPTLDSVFVPIGVLFRAASSFKRGGAERLRLPIRPPW